MKLAIYKKKEYKAGRKNKSNKFRNFFFRFCTFYISIIELHKVSGKARSFNISFLMAFVTVIYHPNTMMIVGREYL